MTTSTIICLTLLVIIMPICSNASFNVFTPIEQQNHFYKKSHNYLNNHYEGKKTNASTYFFNEAILDHYNYPSQNDNWSQRYYIDETHWGGMDFPIFIYIGGEGPQGPPSPRLFMDELAKEHQALMIALEHRFYGESRPTKDLSTESLKFLTSQQALSDLAVFVEYIKDFNMNEKDLKSTPPLELRFSTTLSKVIVFGGSYPGNLAAWFKLKFPSLAIGSIASSAPVYAEGNFEQYAQVVTNALAMEVIGGSTECRQAVSDATDHLHDLANLTFPYASSEKIPTYLKPCNEVKTMDDFAMYLSSIFGNFQGTVQYNDEGQPINVRMICNIMTNTSIPDVVDRLSNVMELFVKKEGMTKCVQSSLQENLIDLVSNTSFSSKTCDLNCNSTRQWIYQSCNEFGFFQTTTASSDTNVFHFPEVTYDIVGKALCERAFLNSPWGNNYKGPNTAFTNVFYGNRNIASTNTTLPGGNVDPWHSLGIANVSDPFYNSCDGNKCNKQLLHSSDEVVFIDGTGHCRDMFASNSTIDTEAIQWAHDKISENVKMYLS